MIGMPISGAANEADADANVPQSQWNPEDAARQMAQAYFQGGGGQDAPTTPQSSGKGKGAGMSIIGAML